MFNLKNRIIIVFAILIAVSFLFFKIKNYLETEESKIRRIILSAKDSTEKENLLKCLSFLSASFLDNYGNDKSTMGALGKLFFKQYDNIRISIRDLKVEVNDLEAKVSIDALVLAKNVADNKAEYNTLKFAVFFVKKENQWSAVRVDWLEPENLFSPLIS